MNDVYDVYVDRKVTDLSQGKAKIAALQALWRAFGLRCAQRRLPHCTPSSFEVL